LWQACHDRVVRMVNILVRLHEHVGLNGPDPAARVTVESLRRFFDEALPRHHEDEEVDLFPCIDRGLHKRPDSESRQIAATLEELRADHRDMAAMWRTLRTPLQELEAGRAATIDPGTLSLFEHRNRRHAELEERHLTPVLTSALSATDLERIGHSMAQRRGLTWGDLGRPPVF